MGKEEIIQRVVNEVTESVQNLLEWSRKHPGCTLEELEERVGALKVELGRQLLEAAVALQGAGGLEAERCGCGGRWIFQGYRERQVMSFQGPIQVKRAYFTCETCGQGIFPPG